MGPNLKPPIPLFTYLVNAVDSISGSVNTDRDYCFRCVSDSEEGVLRNKRFETWLAFHPYIEVIRITKLDRVLMVRQTRL